MSVIERSNFTRARVKYWIMRRMQHNRAYHHARALPKRNSSRFSKKDLHGYTMAKISGRGDVTGLSLLCENIASVILHREIRELASSLERKRQREKSLQAFRNLFYAIPVTDVADISAGGTNYLPRILFFCLIYVT